MSVNAFLLCFIPALCFEVDVISKDLKPFD